MTCDTFEWTDACGVRLEVAPLARGWWTVTVAAAGQRATAVVLPSSEVDMLIRVLRPELPSARYTADRSLASRLWQVYDNELESWVVTFDKPHPDPEAAARAEADRLNGGAS